MARGDGEDGWERPEEPTRDLGGGYEAPCSRQEPSARVVIDNDISSHVIGKRVKILFIAANCRRGQPLALNEEFRAIQRSIQASRFRDAFEIIPELAARPADVRRALLHHRPEIVHVACHGDEDAGLMLLGDDDVSVAVAGCNLASYLRVLRDNIALVVLNACSSSKQAQIIGDAIGMAIGMRQRITDAAAVRFSGAFYEGLAYGRSVRRAFALATLAMGDEQHGVPELFERDGIRASAMCFAGQRVPGAASPGRRASWRVRGATVAAVVTLATIAWCVAVALASALTGLARPTSHDALTLDVVVSSSRGSRSGVLRSGAEVASDDSIQVVVTPAIDAHVYIAYCDRDGRLTMFPDGNGMAAPAGRVTYIPPATGRIVVDDVVGPEVLYVIASRRPLDLADPDLSAALARARSSSAAECGEPVAHALDRGKQAVVEPGPLDLPGRPDMSSPSLVASPSLHASAESRLHSASAAVRDDNPGTSPAHLERGGYIRWGATGNVSAGGDAKDILVLRYNFKHVARR